MQSNDCKEYNNSFMFIPRCQGDLVKKLNNFTIHKGIKSKTLLSKIQERQAKKNWVEDRKVRNFLVDSMNWN